EELKLRVFEHKVLRKIFGAKRDEVTGEWRELHNTELHALYSSPDIIRNIKSRRFRWAGHVARMGESRNSYRVLVGRPARKRPLERPRRRWEDNIKMDMREVGYDEPGEEKENEEKTMRTRGILGEQGEGKEEETRRTMEIEGKQGEDKDKKGSTVVAKKTGPTLVADFRALFTPEHDRLVTKGAIHRYFTSPRYERAKLAPAINWTCRHMAEPRNAYKVLGDLRKERPLGKPRRRLEDNIKMDLNEVGYDAWDWINLAQDRDRCRAYARAVTSGNIKSRRLRWAERVARMGNQKYV
ncbi:hypothetical protein ANN_19990, partial [Periplaneta americana]